jgi:hypothetical protein
MKTIKQKRTNVNLIASIRELIEVFEIKESDKYISLHELTSSASLKSKKEISLFDLFSSSNIEL